MCATRLHGIVRSLCLPTQQSPDSEYPTPTHCEGLCAGCRTYAVPCSLLGHFLIVHSPGIPLALLFTVSLVTVLIILGPNILVATALTPGSLLALISPIPLLCSGYCLGHPGTERGGDHGVGGVLHLQGHTACTGEWCKAAHCTACACGWCKGDLHATRCM